MGSDVDKELLEGLIYCRKHLVENIKTNHSDLSISLLKESVQKILDSILIIKVAEDRGILGVDLKE